MGIFRNGNFLVVFEFKWNKKITLMIIIEFNGS